MNRKHSFQRASRCHRFYQSCIKANFLAFCKRLLTSGQPTALARKWCKNTNTKIQDRNTETKKDFFKIVSSNLDKTNRSLFYHFEKKVNQIDQLCHGSNNMQHPLISNKLDFHEVYASPNILDASSKEDVAVAMVLRGNGYNNEDKDRCDEFFQSLLSSSFSKRLLVTRPQHLLTVHFRYGFHALHYSCHISFLFSIILFLSCEKCGKESTFNSHLQSLRCGVHNPYTVWCSPTCRLLFFIFSIVFIVKSICLQLFYAHNFLFLLLII